jgi:hypothetical protein
MFLIAPPPAPSRRSHGIRQDNGNDDDYRTNSGGVRIGHSNDHRADDHDHRTRYHRTRNNAYLTHDNDHAASCGDVSRTFHGGD